MADGTNILEFAMASRGMQFLGDKCACCGDPVEIGELADFKDSHVTALTAKYSGPVCYGCADDHETCYITGEIHPSNEMRFCEVARERVHEDEQQDPTFGGCDRAHQEIDEHGGFSQ